MTCVQGMCIQRLCVHNVACLRCSCLLRAQAGAGPVNWDDRVELHLKGNMIKCAPCSASLV